MNDKNNIKVVAIEEEMQSAYLDYAMSVIVARALPDVRDGLKPVHRRIIFAMNEAGNQYSKPFRKSARVVGEVMGKYHPHGDAAIYETMVRLAQWFSMRIPLVEGQGNFGSMDGDMAAASRYTEARLSKISELLVNDIDFDTVNFAPNYDNSLKEPSVLPARFPNLLVNGSNGIAVGMATYIPTHNLGEVIDACCAVLDNPNIKLDELINKYIHGPDFPTGGIILGIDGIKKAFKTGAGAVLVRSKNQIVNNGRHDSIIVTEIPYQVNKSKLVERIAELVKNKTIEDIGDIRDESNKDGVRLVIELKKGAIGEIVLNQLFKYTQLQINISYNMLALVKNKPLRLSLREIIDNFLEFRKEVITRRCKYLLNQNRNKAHVLIGFCIALNNIDKVISIVKSASDKNEAKFNLMTEALDIGDLNPMLQLTEDEQSKNSLYKFTDNQSSSILEMKLNKLTNLEKGKIQEELQHVADDIKHLLSVLSSKDKVKEMIKEEMLEIKEKFNTPRLTKIEYNYEDIDDEDLIQKEDMVITYTTNGYIKRVPLENYRTQKRGGRGKNCMGTKDDDLVKDVIIANTHDSILCFSTAGKVYKIKVYKLPLCSSESGGRALVNVLPFDESEKLSNILVLHKDSITKFCNADVNESVMEEGSIIDTYGPIVEQTYKPNVNNNILKEYDSSKNIVKINQNNTNNNKTLVFITSLGNVRRNKFSDFFNIQSNGKKAIKLEENETLVNILLADESDDLFIATKNGLCNRFPVSSIRVFASRDSNGVRGIKLKDNDEVISASLLYKSNIESIEERNSYFKVAGNLRNKIDKLDKNDRMSQLVINEKFILTVTSKGFGQLASFYDYRQISRGTQGCQNMTLNDKNGTVVASFPVNRNDQIMLLTNTGRILRCNISEIRITRRGARGVILFRLNDEVPENEPEELVTSVSRIDDNNSSNYIIDNNIDNQNINNGFDSSNIIQNIEDNINDELMNSKNMFGSSIINNNTNKEENNLILSEEDDNDDNLDDIFGNDK